MPVDPSVIGPATLSMTQALSLFSQFVPRFSEISAADPNDEATVRDVRMGELAAVLMTLGIGGMTSALTGSSVPAVIACTTCVGLVMLYEMALKSTGETVRTSA
jgi:hypothetical protein